MTEPGTGSDLAAMRTTAVRDGDDYVINGAKTFITNGILADLVIVVAQDRPEASRHRRRSACSWSSAAWPGFERGRKLEKIGMHAQDTAELFFEDVPRAGGEPARRGGRGLRAT